MKVLIENGILHSPYPKCEIPCCSVYSAIEKCLQVSPDKIAMIDSCSSLTRAELFVMMKRYAAGFQALGVKLGDRVCVHLDNTVENLVAMFGLLFAGATLILAKPSLTERELYYQMNDGDASQILTDPQNAPKALKLRSTLKLTRMFLVGEAPEFESVRGFSELNENSYEEVEIRDPKNAVVVLSYTSGTTGLPKGVEISHYSFVANLHTSKNCLSSDDTDILLAWNPITHASGFLFTVVAACIGSTCVVSSPAVSFDKFVELVNTYNVTTIASFPSRLQYIVSEMQRTGVRLDSIRKINVGGSVVSEMLAAGIRSVFPNLHCLRNLYAMTESCGIVCSPSPDEFNFGHLGYPAPMVELKFIDLDSGEKVGPHTHAQLYFRIPSCMRGYYGKPQATAEFMDDEGWCRSGDVAYYDEEGKVHFVERLKEMIRCMDNQVVPAEIEDLLLKRHDGIREVAVVGLPHQEYGQVPAAFVVLKNSHKERIRKEIEEEIMDIVAGTCAKHKHLYGGVHIVGSLPKTETGKVRRKALLPQH